MDKGEGRRKERKKRRLRLETLRIMVFDWIRQEKRREKGKGGRKIKQTRGIRYH
jgi:hypothetical protein